MSPSAGTKIGPYLIETLLGEGGMGIVYRALDTKLNLRRLSHQSGETPAAGLPRTNRRFPWAWVALIPVLLITAYFWQAQRAPQSSEPLRATALTTLPVLERYPSFSPDGDRVAFMWTGPRQDNPDIYVQQVGSGSPLRLTTDPGVTSARRGHPMDARSPFFATSHQLRAIWAGKPNCGSSHLWAGQNANWPRSRWRRNTFCRPRTLAGVPTATAWLSQKQPACSSFLSKQPRRRA